MVPSSSLFLLVSFALSPIALARPTTLSLFKRQTSTIPEACTFTCAPVQTALSSCLVSSCLCNEGVLESFVDCSECTLLATKPTNLNASIASYQLAIDAYRQTCAATSPAVNLPNVTVSAPAANATYATASTNSSSISSTLSSNSSSTASIRPTSSASAVSASITSTPSATRSSTGVGAGSATATASSSSTGGAETRLGGGGLGAVLGAAVVMGLVVLI